jgi:hypothetical protein
VWLNDEKRFRLIMEQHGLRDPHMTIPLPEQYVLFRQPDEFAEALGGRDRHCIECW